MIAGTKTTEGTLETPYLTPAEREVLPLLLAGDREWQIALALEKSTATVNKQIGAIYRAYEVNSKHQLIARHYEIEARKNLLKNGPDGVNTPLLAAREAANNPPVARKNSRRSRRGRTKTV
jgi:DNA-binding CsgD family transcriptional regulator